MLIALGRFVHRFGLSAIGRYDAQQGLARSRNAASDFAEDIGSARNVSRCPTCRRPIPCINEVDMGNGIPQTMLAAPARCARPAIETTLHDIRWGSTYRGTFCGIWRFPARCPFGHLKGGIAGATGYRQPPMYFPRGGATITGQCKAGTFIWARASYVDTQGGACMSRCPGTRSNCRRRNSRNAAAAPPIKGRR